jgi:hypothetical protein
LRKFSKRVSIGRKQPDQTGVDLEKHVRNCNDLAEKPIGYRYTIPQLSHDINDMRDKSTAEGEHP